MVQTEQDPLKTRKTKNKYCLTSSPLMWHKIIERGSFQELKAMGNTSTGVGCHKVQHWVQY